MGLLPNYRGTPFAGAIKLDENERVKLKALKNIPFAAYQKELMSRGLGSGSVFQEEGPGLGISSRTSNAMQDARPVSEGGKRVANQFSSEELTKKLIQNLGRDERERNSSVNMPSTLSGIEYALDQIKKAGGSSDASETPLTTLAKRQLQNEEFDVSESRLNSLMESGSESFADSPLDAIAAQIERARLGPLDGSGDQANAQSIIADKQRDAAAEEFRADEAKSFDDTSLTIAEGDKIAEDTFKSAMDGFLGSARGASPDKREKTLAEYKKEFAAATGVDVSGKVDKSQALMAMGLALMQNRAGSGFNVGKILNSVGQAGEKALPALEKAKTKAQTAAIAAGKYALESRGSDQAKDEATSKSLMNRSQYYVYKKGKEGESFANFDQGDLAYLNKYELNKLMKDPKFNEQFNFIDGDDYFEVVKNDNSKVPVDYGDAYGKETKVSLLGGDIEGVNPIYIVDAQRPDGNYKGVRKKFSHMGTNSESVVANFKKEQDSILREEKEFSELIGNIESGVSIPAQIGSSIIQFGRNLGLDLGGGPTQIAQARAKLEKIKLLNATEILQESGKTLSDADRIRVSQFVGTIDLASADDALILQSLGRVYDIILEARQRDLNTAVGNMERDFGMPIDLRPENKPSSQAELDAMNAKDGTSLTMDDYK
jgi:hypothetical protein